MSDPAKTLPLLYAQIGAYLDAGVSVLKAFASLCDGPWTGDVARALRRVEEVLKGGGTLHEGMEASPAVFPEFDCAVMRAGEASGTVVQSCRILERFWTEKLALRREAVRIAIYPVILVVLAALVGPLPALILQGPGVYLPRAGIPLAVLVACLGAVVLFNSLALRSRTFAANWDTLKLAIPFVGGVVRDFAVVRLLRALSTVWHAGIPISTGIPMAVQACGNAGLTHQLWASAERFRNEPISLSELVASWRLPVPFLAEFVRTGEESGRVPESLEHAARTAEASARERMKAVQKLFSAFVYGIAVIYAIFTILTTLPGGMI